jgi:hypothetical protein
VIKICSPLPESIVPQKEVLLTFMMINPLDVSLQVELLTRDNENCVVVLPVSKFKVPARGGLLDFDNSGNTLLIKANITPLTETNIKV